MRTFLVLKGKKDKANKFRLRKMTAKLSRLLSRPTIGTNSQVDSFNNMRLQAITNKFLKQIS